eukprot:scaffold10895_cov51-Phaeocystis_antarctica.AAC.1
MGGKFRGPGLRCCSADRGMRVGPVGWPSRRSVRPVAGACGAHPRNPTSEERSSKVTPETAGRFQKHSSCNSHGDLARGSQLAISVLCPLTTLPLWRLVGCRRPPEIKLDVGVFWGESELLLLQAKYCHQHCTPPYSPDFHHSGKAKSSRPVRPSPTPCRVCYSRCVSSPLPNLADSCVHAVPKSRISHLDTLKYLLTKSYRNAVHVAGSV